MLMYDTKYTNSTCIKRPNTQCSMWRLYTQHNISLTIHRSSIGFSSLFHTIL